MQVDTSIIALFLAGTLSGLLLMLIILTSKKFAYLLLMAVALTLLAGVIVEGPNGLLNWLSYSVDRILKASVFFSGLGIGKILSAALVSVLRRHD